MVSTLLLMNLAEKYVQDEETDISFVDLKLFILYADNTIILVESHDELQAAIYGMYHY